MKLTKNRYLAGFSIVVIFLALVRYSVKMVTDDTVKEKTEKVADIKQGSFYDADGKRAKHKIYSVVSYKKEFPDENDIQLISAREHGVDPVYDRNEAENSKKDLVFIGTNPFYHVEKLSSSIPYLVPKAAVLLQDIGCNFFDSLAVKQVPLHKIIVTSVMRTKKDIEKLRKHNVNATENSCHLYGTTFDISYNRYITVPGSRTVQNDSLKWILSEVISDLRKNERCHVKYEVKQGCFHITIK